jgi:hypothetical protein
MLHLGNRPAANISYGRTNTIYTPDGTTPNLYKSQAPAGCQLMSQLELKLFMSRVRYYHIALSHIALFRLSLLSECNILGEGSGRCSPDNIHSLKLSIDISVGESSGESYAGRPTETSLQFHHTIILNYNNFWAFFPLHSSITND